MGRGESPDLHDLHDLHDALAPLRGDPVADAAKVLGALPSPPAVPPIAWWLLAAGLLVGLCIGPFFASDPPKPDPTPTPTGADPKAPEKNETQRVEERIMYYGTAAATVDEPTSGKQPLTAGADYIVEMGARFSSESGTAGMLLAYNSQLRMAQWTQVTVESATSITLHEGEIWVMPGREANDGMMVVATPRGLVDIHGGACDLSYRDGKLRVICLSGETVLQMRSGQPLRLQPGTMGLVTESGHEGPEKIEFVAGYTSWMTGLLKRQQDATELRWRIQEMIRYYFEDERYRDAAQKELERIGSRAIPALVERLAGASGSPSPLVRRAAEMVCNRLASRDTVLHLFRLLEHPDPEVRVLTFENIHRIAGSDGDTDADFWRDDANRPEFGSKIGTWWNEVSR